MKFATKLSLGCIALLSCALGAAGLLLTGQSFSGSLASTRTALQAQQEKEKYALERFIFQATDSAQFENYILASAAQQYAEQTTDGTGCLGNTSTFDVKGKIRRKKPVMQIQAMLHCPVVQLFKCVPVIAKICETIHKQTISGRSSERIYNINLTLRVAFFQCLLCNHGGIDNAGNAG